MALALILLGLGLAISLAFNFGLVGSKAPQANKRQLSPQENSADSEKKKQEFERLKAIHNELKVELKAFKKKLFDLQASEKADSNLARARFEVERQASIQLENTRYELSIALAEVQRLKEERPVSEPAHQRSQPSNADRQQHVIRELSEAEKERIAKLESQASADRKRASDLNRALQGTQKKLEHQFRVSKRTRGEANLARDKFRAVEMRLNRTLLENDLLKRALAALEKRAELQADRISLTAEEIAESDRRIQEKHEAEDQTQTAAHTDNFQAVPNISEEPEGGGADETPPAEEGAAVVTASPAPPAEEEAAAVTASPATATKTQDLAPT